MVCLGVIAGAFGVRGEVRVKSFTEPPDNIGNYGDLTTDPGDRRLTIESLRPVKNGLALRFKGVDDRDQAEALKGTRLMVDRDALPATEEDEFYYVDLVGCRAKSQSGRNLGEVVAVYDFGAGPLVEIGEKGKTVMVPFTKELVPIVDIKAKRLVIADAALAEEEEER